MFWREKHYSWYILNKCLKMSININAARLGDSSLLAEATQTFVENLHLSLVLDKGLPVKMIT